MKNGKIWALVLLIASFNYLFSQTSDLSVENSLKNCALQIRYGMQFCTPQQKSYNYTAYVDTLYRYLYCDSVNVKNHIEFFSKITLQSYFIEMNDERVDYFDVYKSLLITHKFNSFHDPFFFTCARGLADYWEKNFQWEKSVEARDWAIKSLIKFMKSDDTPMAYLLNSQNAAICFVRLKNYELSLKYRLACCRIAERLEGYDSEMYEEELRNLSSGYNIAGYYEKADSCLNIVQGLMEKRSDGDLVEVLYDRAEINSSLERWPQAAMFYKSALQKVEVQGELYIEMLYGLAISCYGLNDYSGMNLAMQSLLDYLEQNPFANHEMMFRLLTLCNSSHISDERKKLLTLAEKMSDRKDVATLATLAYAYQKNYKYEKFNELAGQVFDLMDGYRANNDSIGIEQGLPFVQVLGIGNKYQKKTIEYLLYNINSCKQRLGKSHPLVFDMLAQLSSLYNMVGKYRQSIELADSCLALPGLSELQYNQFVRNKIDAMSSVGQYLRAVELSRSLLPNLKNGKDSWDILANGIIGNMLAEMDLRQNNEGEFVHDDSKELLSTLCRDAEILVARTKETYGESHMNYIISLEYLASAYYLNRQWTQMLQIVDRCESLIRANVKNEELKAVYLECLTPFYLFVKDYKKASLLVNKKNLENAFLFAERNNTAMLLADIALGLGKYKEAEKYYSLQADDIISYSKLYFSSLTETERNNFWRMFSQQIYDAGKFVASEGKPSRFAGKVYDLALFSKGLLLNSSLLFERQVHESGDIRLQTDFDELEVIKRELVNNLSFSETTRTTLRNRVETLEAGLMSRLQSYRDYTEFLSVSWKDVQKHLKNTDLSIEFIDYNRQDSIAMYGALLLKKEWNAPVFIPLTEKTAYDKTQREEIRVSAENGGKIWNPIKPFMDGVERIYFSPVGVLHKVPIEYMPYDDSLMIAEKFDMYRLSSTRILAKKRKPNQWSGAVLYGGIEYDATNVSPNDADARGERQIKLTYLAGTDKEVRDIDKLLSSKQIHVDLYQEENATEESFKKLSGSDVQLIHLATHGLYLLDSDVVLDKIPSLRLSATLKGGDRVMENTAVCFAGVNNTQLATDLEMSDEGFLSAREITVMDLSHTDMVVLSACLTAEGEVTGEGVFGLQRGFKQAGANTIVMALWKVNDKSTSLLMSSFYKNMVNGMLKNKALVEAVKQLRSAGSQYADPKYWAAFIMLDGLE